MFVRMAGFGAPDGVRVGSHVGVDVPINRMNGAWRRRFVVPGLRAGAPFTGIGKFEIMAVPFPVLANSFLTHGGVARRMIGFAAVMVDRWHAGQPPRSPARRFVNA